MFDIWASVVATIFVAAVLGVGLATFIGTAYVTLKFFGVF